MTGGIDEDAVTVSGMYLENGIALKDYLRTFGLKCFHMRVKERMIDMKARPEACMCISKI